MSLSTVNNYFRRFHFGDDLGSDIEISVTTNEVPVWNKEPEVEYLGKAKCTIFHFRDNKVWKEINIYWTELKAKNELAAAKEIESKLNEIIAKEQMKYHGIDEAEDALMDFKTGQEVLSQKMQGWE